MTTTFSYKAATAILLLSLPSLHASKSIEAVVQEVLPEQQSLLISISSHFGNKADPENTANPETISVQVGRGDLALAHPGWEIRGELVPYGSGQRLQVIFPNDSTSRGMVATLGQRLNRDTRQRGSKVFRAVGEQLPRFALWDQKGQLFHSESLRGNYAVINFIFTRCAMPNMCPAATERMHRLQELARQRGITDLHLVSITLDPEYDTPGIFHTYGEDKELDPEVFHLLGGPAQIVEDLKAQLGVLAEPDAEQIIRHTLSTALVDPTGRIIYRIPGSMWDPEVFLRQIDKHRNPAQP